MRKFCLGLVVFFGLIAPGIWGVAHAQQIPTTITASAPTTTCNGSFNLSDLTNGDILLPPFLRSATSAQAAGFDCVVAAINYYTSLLLLVVSVAAFLYLLYGAFTYMTAFGEESKAQQAKKIITQALIGLVVAALAFALVAAVRTFLQA